MKKSFKQAVASGLGSLFILLAVIAGPSLKVMALPMDPVEFVGEYAYSSQNKLGLMVAGAKIYRIVKVNNSQGLKRVADLREQNYACVVLSESFLQRCSKSVSRSSNGSLDGSLSPALERKLKNSFEGKSVVLQPSSGSYAVVTDSEIYREWVRHQKSTFGSRLYQELRFSDFEGQLKIRLMKEIFDEKDISWFNLALDADGKIRQDLIKFPQYARENVKNEDPAEHSIYIEYLVEIPFLKRTVRH